MPVFDITVLCEDDDGSRTVLGNSVITAATMPKAQEQARDEHWDERLTRRFLCVFKTTEVENPCPVCKKQEAILECGSCDTEICENCCGDCCGSTTEV